jgi:hypothetical protein
MIDSWEESDYFWAPRFDNAAIFSSTIDCSTVQRFWRSTGEFALRNHAFRVGEATGCQFACVICNTEWHVQICLVKVAILSTETSKSPAPNYLFRISKVNCSTLHRFWKVHCWICFRNHTFGVGEALGLLFAYVICNTKCCVAFTPTKHKTKLEFRGAEKLVIRQYSVFWRSNSYEKAVW